MDKNKRAKWTVDEMVLSVRHATAHHDQFVVSIFPVTVKVPPDPPDPGPFHRSQRTWQFYPKRNLTLTQSGVGGPKP